MLLVDPLSPNSSPCLCRTETVVEKLLTNWMSICLYTFVRVREAEFWGQGRREGQDSDHVASDPVQFVRLPNSSSII